MRDLDHEHATKSAHVDNNPLSPIVLQTPPLSLYSADGKPSPSSVVAVDTVDTVGSVCAVETIYAIRMRLLCKALAVQWTIATPQTGCSLLRRDVTLRFGQHLVTDLKLADSCTAEKRGIKVNMEMAAFDLISSAFQRRLVNAHA